MAMKAFLKKFKYVPESERNEEKPTTFYMITLSRAEMIQFISTMINSLKIDISSIQNKKLDDMIPQLQKSENIENMVNMYSELILKSVVRIDNFYIGDKFYPTTESPEIIKTFLSFLPSLELVFELGNQAFTSNMPTEIELKNLK